MKKTLTLFVGLFLVISLSSCGQTQEEKNQEKALKGGFEILKEMGENSQNGASDQEVMNKGLDKLADLAGSITDGTDEELTKEEKDALKKGADMLKNGGEGLRNEMSEQMSNLQKQEEERRQKEKVESLKVFGNEEQPEWAVKKGIIKPEGLTFEYRNATFKPDNYAYIMDYRAHYTAGSKKTMEEAERLLKKLNLKVTHTKKSSLSPETVAGAGMVGNLRYQIQADEKWLTISVMNTKWSSEVK